MHVMGVCLCVCVFVLVVACAYGFEHELCIDLKLHMMMVLMMSIVHGTPKKRKEPRAYAPQQDARSSTCFLFFLFFFSPFYI